MAADSPIAKAADFNGKTIGVTGLKNIAQVGAQAWLQANGGDLSQIKFVELPVQTMLPAVVLGRLAGAIVVEPFLSTAPSNGGRLFAPAVHRADWAETTDIALAQPLIDAAAKFGAIGAAFPAARLFRA